MTWGCTTGAQGEKWDICKFTLDILFLTVSKQKAIDDEIKKETQSHGTRAMWLKNILICPLLTDSNKLAPATLVLPTFSLGHKDHFPTEILWRHFMRSQTRREEGSAVAKLSFCFFRIGGTWSQTGLHDVRFCLETSVMFNISHI